MFSFFSDVPHIITLAPLCKKDFAMASPIPPLPPTISATLFFKSCFSSVHWMTGKNFSFFISQYNLFKKLRNPIVHSIRSPCSAFRSYFSRLFAHENGKRAWYNIPSFILKRTLLFTKTDGRRNRRFFLQSL